MKFQWKARRIREIGDARKLRKNCGAVHCRSGFSVVEICANALGFGGTPIDALFGQIQDAVTKNKAGDIQEDNHSKGERQ
jgi:hypothetical protein